MSKDLARSASCFLAMYTVPLHSGVDDGAVIYFCVGNVLLDEANSEGLLEVDRAYGTERVVKDQFRCDVIIKERAEDVGGQGHFCPIGVVGERAFSEYAWGQLVDLMVRLLVVQGVALGWPKAPKMICCAEAEQGTEYSVCCCGSLRQIHALVVFLEAREDQKLLNHRPYFRGNKHPPDRGRRRIDHVRRVIIAFSGLGHFRGEGLKDDGAQSVKCAQRLLKLELDTPIASKLQQRVLLLIGP
jgi:hypothetical protein